MNTSRIVAELAHTDADTLLLVVDKFGGHLRSDQAVEVTGFTRTHVHKLTRRLSGYELVMANQLTLAEDVNLTPRPVRSQGRFAAPGPVLPFPAVRGRPPRATGRRIRRPTTPPVRQLGRR